MTQRLVWISYKREFLSCFATPPFFITVRKLAQPPLCYGSRRIFLQYLESFLSQNLNSLTKAGFRGGRNCFEFDQLK